MTNPRSRAGGFNFEDMFAGAQAFHPHEARNYTWGQRYSTAQYLELLRTYSDTRVLPPDQHDALQPRL